jgi:hypothetical protein
VLTDVRMPRMNSITERWVKTLRTELLDRTLIWNETHLRHTLREYNTEPTDHLPLQHPCEPAPSPLIPTRSNASPYAGWTVSAESSTSIDMPLDPRA